MLVIQKVLIPLDGSPLAERALLPLRRLLGAEEGAHAVLLHVLPPGLESEERAAAHEAADQVLEQVASRLAAWPLACERRVVEGDPAGGILDAATEVHPDLICMATHGRTGVSRMVRGSVAERVLRGASAPLLMVNAGDAERGDEGSFQRLLVPLDGSPLADAILPYAIAIARTCGSKVQLLRVEPLEPYLNDPLAGFPMLEPRLWNEQTVKETLQPQAERLRGAGIDAEVVARIGDAAREISHAAESADLVCLSSHGRSGPSRWWFGSVAEQVLRSCHRPLLLVRGKG
ncbi:MAG: universal stress protein [Planctomycetota bacterium]